jgi:putative ABC transport system substrate-binding protein
VFRAANGNFGVLQELARDLVELKVDVILTLSTPPAVAARQATKDIPIVTISSDPVGAGLIESFARPGGNVTGLYVPLESLAAKRLQLLKETVPDLSSVVVVWNPNNPPARRQREATEEAARSLGLRTYGVELASKTDLTRALQAISARKARGLIIMQDPVTFSLRQELADFARRNRLPTSHAYREFVDAGGLMSYGFSMTGLWEAAAQYADKVLRGSRPEDLPMAEPTRVELAINLRTAKAFHLQFPESILLRADEVIR